MYIYMNKYIYIYMENTIAEDDFLKYFKKLNKSDVKTVFLI